MNNEIKFLELNFLSYDLAGKDEREDLKIDRYKLKCYDEYVIGNINYTINEYEGYITQYQDIVEYKEHYEKNSLDLILNENITFESWIYTLYLHELKKLILEIELLETLGYNIYSASVARVIRDLKAKVNQEIEEVKLLAYFK